MTSIDANAIIEALTRTKPPRNVILNSSRHFSDEELIKQIAGNEISDGRINLLVSVSRLLRLMDSLLSNKETGESFVAKFSEQWLLIRNWKEDPSLEKEFDRLNEFYTDIQLFCAIPAHRREEPLLFGLDHLISITQAAYESLKEKFALSLPKRTGNLLAEELIGCQVYTLDKTN